MHTIKLYDTTLRDGTQSEDVAFSLEDKVRIAHKLDEIGIHYIEGGWPGSNPKDIAFFKAMKGVKLSHSKIAAFGSTRRANLPVTKDVNIRALLESGTEVVTIFGKSWDFHVKEALRITLNQNLELIFDSLVYLKENVGEVIYDAEHFFDGYKANPEYAMKTLLAAQDAKVNCIVLCDTNGGSLTSEIVSIITDVKEKIKIPIGIHCHNDSELAVANSIAAVQNGIVHVQGTFNGFGERCGNANLCSIIPNIKLKLKLPSISEKNLSKLTEISRYVYEIANLSPFKHQPYVGVSAFAHKGGVHVSAVQRHSGTYEHIMPEIVGNRQRVLISDLSGRSNIIEKAKQFNIKLDDKDPATSEILAKLKELENSGFQFEGAEASFELLMKKTLKKKPKRFFKLIGFRVIDEKVKEDEPSRAEAVVMVEGPDKSIEHTAAIGNGPVNALDNALRKALEKFYPSLKEVKLLDFKVRVLSAGKGTSAVVRVLIESGDKTDKWGTVGVSHNIIEASWQALIDSITYKLEKDKRKKGKY